MNADKPGKHDGPTPGLERLRRHAEQCDECRVAPLPLAELSALLSAPVPVRTEVPASRRVLVAAAPLLAAYAARAYRRHLVSGMVLSLVPLPVVVFFNVYLLREAYALLAGWLPSGIVAWMVVGYGAMLLLLCALTYAALPVLIARARVQATA
jgi:hypothetical protein